MDFTVRKAHKFHQGWLEHKSQLYNNWEKYWCVLQDQVLFLFHQCKTSAETLAGTLTITPESRFEKKDGDENTGYKFNLYTQKRMNHFKASKFSERELWKAFIHGISTGSVPDTIDLLPGQIEDVRHALQQNSQFIARNKHEQQTHGRRPSEPNGRDLMTLLEGFDSPNEYYSDSFVAVQEESPERLDEYMEPSPPVPVDVRSQDLVFYLDATKKGVPNWFFSNCTRQLAEKILKSGFIFGNTLLRESNEHYNKSLAISKIGSQETPMYSHYKILVKPNGYYLDVENFHNPMKTLSEVMDFFVNTSGQASTTPMTCNNLKKLGIPEGECDHNYSKKIVRSVQDHDSGEETHECLPARKDSQSGMIRDSYYGPPDVPAPPPPPPPHPHHDVPRSMSVPDIGRLMVEHLKNKQSSSPHPHPKLVNQDRKASLDQVTLGSPHIGHPAGLPKPPSLPPNHPPSPQPLVKPHSQVPNSQSLLKLTQSGPISSPSPPGLCSPTMKNSMGNASSNMQKKGPNTAPKPNTGSKSATEVTLYQNQPPGSPKPPPLPPNHPSSNLRKVDKLNGKDPTSQSPLKHQSSASSLQSLPGSCSPSVNSSPDIMPKPSASSKSTTATNKDNSKSESTGLSDYSNSAHADIITYAQIMTESANCTSNSIYQNCSEIKGDDENYLMMAKQREGAVTNYVEMYREFPTFSQDDTYEPIGDVKSMHDPHMSSNITKQNSEQEIIPSLQLAGMRQSSIKNHHHLNGKIEQVSPQNLLFSESEKTSQRARMSEPSISCSIKHKIIHKRNSLVTQDQENNVFQTFVFGIDTQASTTGKFHNNFGMKRNGNTYRSVSDSGVYEPLKLNREIRESDTRNTLPRQVKMRNNYESKNYPQLERFKDGEDEVYQIIHFQTDISNKAKSKDKLSSSISPPDEVYEGIEWKPPDVQQDLKSLPGRKFGQGHLGVKDKVNVTNSTLFPSKPIPSCETEGAHSYYSEVNEGLPTGLQPCSQACYIDVIASYEDIQAARAARGSFSGPSMERPQVEAFNVRRSKSEICRPSMIEVGSASFRKKLESLTGSMGPGVKQIKPQDPPCHKKAHGGPNFSNNSPPNMLEQEYESLDHYQNIRGINEGKK